MSKFRVFKLVSKEDLEKFRSDPKNKEILEKIKLGQEVSDNLVQNFLRKNEKSPQENQKIINTNEAKLPFIHRNNIETYQENKFSHEETKAYRGNIEGGSKHNSKNSNTPKNDKLIEFLKDKKHKAEKEIQLLQEEIKKLETKLKEVIEA